jgi:hypothetical protein
MSTVRFVGVIKLSSGAPKMLVRGDAMVLGVAGNPLLAGAAGAAATLKTDLDTLRAKQAAVKDGGTAASTARNTAMTQVKRDMETFLAIVQQLADASPNQAEAIITAAGLYVRKVVTRTKAELAILQGASSGIAIARAKSRGRGAIYWWAVSADQKTWSVEALPTKKAKTSFANLTPGTTYYFRFQAFTASGMSDWSQIVAFMVK